MPLGEYVYCIIASKGAPKEFNIHGMEGTLVCLSKYKGLAAVTSKAEFKEYRPTDENIEIHKKVELEILKEHSILPVAYGMVFKNKGVVLGTMKKVYPVLWSSLKRVDGKVELGIKAIIPTTKEELERLLGEKNLTEFRKECEEEFTKPFEEIAASIKKGTLFSEKLVCNYSFLIEKDKVDRFTEKVSQLRDKFQDLKIQYTGPWPAHDFVNIRIMSRR